MSQSYHERYKNNPDFVWVNCCQMYVMKSKLIDGECPYHQKVTISPDGEVSFRYDEFNQDGEEW